MKLLILTQKVDINDDILGFMHGWIEEFSKRCEKITVVALGVGEYKLPKNVKVLSLGKETGESKIKYLINFYKYILQERHDYDTVFVHMNYEYVILGGWYWRLVGKKIALWYVHKQVSFHLKLAEKIANVIFTVSKESFKIKTDKLKIIGHGIPVEFFKNPQAINYKKGDKLKIISVGRITKIKNLDTLIRACIILKKEDLNFEVSLVGPVVSEEDKKYFGYLKQLISENNLNEEIKFLGSVPNHKINEYYWNSDISVNLCPSGGVDKAILESMAAGLLVLVSNVALEEYFGKYKSILVFEEKNAQDLANKIISLISRTDLDDVRNFLFSVVKEKAGLADLILKIINNLNGKTN